MLTAGQLAADGRVRVFLHLQVGQGHLLVARLLRAAGWGQWGRGPLLLRLCLPGGAGLVPGSRGCGPAPLGTLLTFPSASAFTAILPILRFMVREMTARHFLPSFIPLLRAASSGAALLGSSSGIWRGEGAGRARWGCRAPRGAGPQSQARLGRCCCCKPLRLPHSTWAASRAGGSGKGAQERAVGEDEHSHSHPD